MGRQPRRLAVFTVGRDTMLEALAGRVYIEGIPEGATVVGVESNVMCLGFDIVLEHPDFPEVQEGTLIPRHEFMLYTRPADDAAYIKELEEVRRIHATCPVEFEEEDEDVY